MPWSYDYNSKLQIVEVVYEGQITADDLSESTSKHIELEHKKGWNRFLVDATKMKMATSIMAVYDLPAKQYIEEKADRQGCVAVLLPEDTIAKEAVEFYETVCRNRGWMVQVFSERQAAIDYLNRSRTANKPHTGDSP